jgi:hypothetical protein
MLTPLMLQAAVTVVCGCVVCSHQVVSVRLLSTGHTRRKAPLMRSPELPVFGGESVHPGAILSIAEQCLRVSLVTLAKVGVGDLAHMPTCLAASNDRSQKEPSSVDRITSVGRWKPVFVVFMNSYSIQ